MFNGYNETPLISYNEFSQDRGEKKQENVPKWSYGHTAGGQPSQPHSNSRHSEFWSGKPNFLGIPNVLKCSCAGCYPSSENQSYQSDSTRHRPWLPRTFSVPLNGSNEPCKLPMYQWDNGLSNQVSCYPESNHPYVQESGGKYGYYRHCQNPRLPEPNQPGVITTLKTGDYSKKPKNEMHSPIQNGGRQPILYNPAYNLSKRVDGRNCDPNEKYSNVVSYSVDQQIPRLPVVEPFLKAVPSNLSQNRVPSTGYRSVKENTPQQYVSSGYGDARRIAEPMVNGDKRCEAFPVAQLQSGLHLDYSYLNRDVPDMETQKLFFDNTRHSDYYSKNNFQDVIKWNGQTLDSRKDCTINQTGISEQHYNTSRSKYQEAAAVVKPSYEVFYSKDFEKSRQESHLPEDPTCFQRNEGAKTENSSAQARMSRSALLFNEQNFSGRTQNSCPYQSEEAAYTNNFRSECQGYNAQTRHKYPSDFQNFNQYRATAQQMQSCEQLPSQQGGGFIYDVHYQHNVDKSEQFNGGKYQSSIQTDSQAMENRKPTYLEAIRSEEVNKNGTSKISPLRLLRKKKFINVPQEPPSVSTFDATNPGLDVRKFWSTWAEVEEENVAPTQMVVLDCQNIDPEQAKLLQFYESDPVRAVHLESGSIVIKNAVKESVSQMLEETKAIEQSEGEKKIEKEANLIKEVLIPEDGKPEKADAGNLQSFSESDKKSDIESNFQKPSPSTPVKKEKFEKENRGKKNTEIMDKWTEKKFDFLKRAEESKAAEILRHEEEKKKIFETRLCLQQNLKKIEKSHAEAEESTPETASPFNENCRTDSPEEEKARSSHLPTSEYRRNKFLDYSDRIVIVNGKDGAEKSESSGNGNETTEAHEARKEENLQHACLSKWMDRHAIQKLSPAFNAKPKEEPAVEMDDVMKKMSEINIQNAEGKNGLENDGMKKPKGPLTRKLKKKKLDLKSENEDRPDKVMVEAVSKPTIKFSIQKSHDLKISFKVLNSSNDYSEKDLEGRDEEVKGNVSEECNKSTELITLKYKSIQRDGDRKKNLGFKKGRRTFRRKKQNSGMKTSTFKFKKNSCTAGEERDPLADDSEPSNVTDERSTSDDFQVKETVDSAKIKLTFKRHKGNFETEYKINSSNVEKVPELYPPGQENDRHLETTKAGCRKKSRTRNTEIFAEPGVETFQAHQETSADVDSESEKFFLESPIDDFRNSLTPESSQTGKENFELEPALSAFEFPPGTPVADPSPESTPSPSDEKERLYVIEDSKSNEETNKCRPERGEFTVNHLISCDNGSEEKRHGFSTLDYNTFPDVNTKGSTPKGTESPEESLEEAELFEEDEEIKEISPDFIKSTKSREIETNHKSRKTEENGRVENDPETIKGENYFLGILEKAQQSKVKDGKDGGKAFDLEISKVPENWKVVSEGTADVGKPSEFRIEDSPRGFSNVLQEAPSLINFEDEDENCKKTTTDERGKAESNEVANALLISERTAEFHPPERDVVNCESQSTTPRREADEGKTFESDLNGADPVRNFTKQDSECHFPNPEESSLQSEPSIAQFLSADDGHEKVAAVQEQSESGSVLQKCSGHLEYEGDLLKFEDEIERNYVDGAESESFDVVGGDFPGAGFHDLSPPEKIIYESPEISFEEDHFSNEEGEVKGGDNEVEEPNGSYLALKDTSNAEGAVVSSNKLSRENAKECERVEELSDPKTCVSDSRLPPTICDLVPSETLSEKDSGSAECRFSTRRTVEDKRSAAVNCFVTEDVELACQLDLELEEGEIVDSSDDLTECFDDSIPQRSFDKFARALKRTVCVGGEAERRHSMDSKNWSETSEPQTRVRRKFSKTRSCPPEIKYPEGRLVKEEPNFSVEDIPLPVGPPPLTSCLHFEEYMNKSDSTEAKKERRVSISTERRLTNQKEISVQASQPSNESPFGLKDFRNCENPSPPIFVKDSSSHLAIFQRSSKIKFSFSKRSKFSRLGLNKTNDSKVETAFDTQSGEVRDESGKREVESPDFEKNKKIRTPEPQGFGSQPKACKTEKVPRDADGKKEKSPAEEEDVKSSNHSEGPAQLLGGELGEPVEAMPDFIRDQFYECECLPASEDLANGDELELEKVNDDKFRNIMQNCIDNAKKFLSIGNLKLFSCSVDDLLEVDSRTTSGGNESEKPINHIVRDVLLTACDDDNEEMGLHEDGQFADVAVDFGPSFSSDTCPEILPVDNWPYLEEEVPSSPTVETDLIPTLENPSSALPDDHDPPHKIGFRSFRRRSVVSGEEAFKPCSKVGARRRNTIDCFRSFGKNICDIKNERVRVNGEPGEFEKSLKCRVSLRKLSYNRDPDYGLENGKMRKCSEEFENRMKERRSKRVNYKSPSWQPKVMLFRISKNELRKVLKSSKTYKRFKSETSANSHEADTSVELEDEILKKRKCSFVIEEGHINSEEEMKKKTGIMDSGSEETFVSLTPLSSSFIKGSLKTTDSNKKKKSRFRNLHTKRKSECGTRHSSSKQSKTSNVAKTVLTETFKDCHKISPSEANYPKDWISGEEDEQKPKQQPDDKPENPNFGNDKRLEKFSETPRSCGKSKEKPKENRHREKSDKRQIHGDRREREDRKRRDKHGESDGKRHDGHVSGHDRIIQGKESSGGTRSGRRDSERKEAEMSRSEGGEKEKKTKILKEVSVEVSWVCDVCGFSDAAERVVHIKSHPFHCQSCHLAFKTEAHFVNHLTKKHKDIRNQHHCLLCELSFDTEEQYQKHLDTREHRHLEAVEKNTINTLFTLLTGAPCPVLGIVEMKPEWLPNQAGTVHFYHQATPLSLALQYLKMHHHLSSFSASSAHPS